jgi:hypothetical protein
MISLLMGACVSVSVAWRPRVCVLCGISLSGGWRAMTICSYLQTKQVIICKYTLILGKVIWPKPCKCIVQVVTCVLRLSDEFVSLAEEWDMLVLVIISIRFWNCYRVGVPRLIKAPLYYMYSTETCELAWHEHVFQSLRSLEWEE